MDIKYRNILYFIPCIIFAIILFLLPTEGINLIFMEHSRFPIAIFIDHNIKLYLNLIVILWFVTIIYSIGYIKYGDYDGLIYNINLSIIPAIIVAIAGDMISMIAGYELLTLTTYPLIVKYSKDKYTEKSGFIYIIMLIGLPILFMIPSAVVMSYISGTTLIKISSIPKNVEFLYYISLITFILGNAKLAYMPAHFWLPKAMIAPAPVSGILHAVAVVNTGIIVLYKVICYKLGLHNYREFIKSYNFLIDIIEFVICITTVLGAFLAVKAQKIKLTLAYSTISQLSYIMLVIINGSKAAEQVVISQLISHSIAKISLFFIFGIIIKKYNISEFKELKPLIFFKNKILSLLYILSSLSILGVPYTMGGYSKTALLESLYYDKMSYYSIITASIMSYIYILKPIYYCIKQFSQLKFSLAHNYSYKNEPFITLSFVILIISLIFMR